MLISLRNFIRKHIRKFVVGGVFVGSLYALTKFGQWKLKEIQEKELNELLERSKRKLHFESTERTCNQTAIMLSSRLREAIVKCLDCEQILNDLRDGNGDKIASWGNLRILSFSRTATVIYSYTMFVITLRVQLNVLGGHMYKDSKTSQTSVNDDKIREEYLSICSYLMDEGIKNMAGFIREKVHEITVGYSLGHKLNLRDIQHIYWAITSTVTAAVKEDPVKNITTYMISPEFVQKHMNNRVLSNMIEQTMDLLESQEVQDLMLLNVRCGFSLLIDRISKYFVDKEISDKTINEFINYNSMTLPMAKVIPILNAQTPDLPVADDLPSDWLQKLLSSEELKALGANIYESLSY